MHWNKGKKGSEWSSCFVLSNLGILESIQELSCKKSVGNLLSLADSPFHREEECFVVCPQDLLDHETVCVFLGNGEDLWDFCFVSGATSGCGACIAPKPLGLVLATHYKKLNMCLYFPRMFVLPSNANVLLYEQCVLRGEKYFLFMCQWYMCGLSIKV